MRRVGGEHGSELGFVVIAAWVILGMVAFVMWVASW